VSVTRLRLRDPGRRRCRGGAVAAVVALFLCAVAPSADAQLQAENLLVKLPAGFMVGSRHTQNGMHMEEWVPEGQTVDDWSEMVTMQIFFGRGAWDPVGFLNSLGQGWLSTCRGGSEDPMQSSQANGYPVSMVLMHCPLNPKAGKPETTLLRAIKGKDSFYLAQYAVRAASDKDQVAKMDKYLGTVTVCDTRSSDHPCPDLKAKGVVPVVPR